MNEQCSFKINLIIDNILGIVSAFSRNNYTKKHFMATNQMKKTTALLGLLLIPLISGRLQAIEHQSHKEIRATAEKFLASNYRHMASAPTIQMLPLDRRLKLARCSRPINAFLLPASRSFGRVSVGIRCKGEQSWTIYTSALVKLFKEVVILSQTLGRETEILPHHLTLKKVDISTLRTGYLLSPKQAVGKKLKRLQQAGSVVNQRQLVTPFLVKKGRMVTIIAATKKLSIRMSGKALSNGAKGDRIKIKNIKSGKIIEAKVIADGLVKISL